MKRDKSKMAWVCSEETDKPREANLGYYGLAGNNSGPRTWLTEGRQGRLQSTAGAMCGR